MQIRDELQSQLQCQESMFRAQLMREDIARLDKLVTLADDSQDLAAFKKAGTYIGWTQNDMMTHLLASSLDSLLDAIYAWRAGTGDEAAINTAWTDFCTERNEKLIKCL
ncbi:MAG: hypothetical protein HKN11_18320 [Rhizobiales bacterium]|nr:hypothetical protein [Hyphomicrobiales bacterium]